VIALSVEDKINELHARVLDPDDGLFARVQLLTYKVDGLIDEAADDAEAHERLRERLSSLESSRSRLKGWLAGVAAGGGALGALASRLLGQ